MNRKSITLTIIANMTSNYSESLGNVGSVQKVFKNRKVYAIRSRESLKNAIMIESGMYDDLKTDVIGTTQKKVTQKVANEEINASNCRALEGGYMSTKALTYVRNSSFYLTDAIATESFVNENRFHNNLYMATNYANNNGLNVQEKAKAVGLMPYQYEYDKSLKIYSITIDLEMIGKDENFNQKADNKEKAERVKLLLKAVEHLSLVVKGNLDNSEPLFVVGGLCDRKTHYFENVIRVKEDNLIISEDLLEKVNEGYSTGLLKGNTFVNEDEIIEKLNPKSVSKFFKDLCEEVDKYYGV